MKINTYVHKRKPQKLLREVVFNQRTTLHAIKHEAVMIFLQSNFHNDLNIYRTYINKRIQK